VSDDPAPIEQQTLDRIRRWLAADTREDATLPETARDYVKALLLDHDLRVAIDASMGMRREIHNNGTSLTCPCGARFDGTATAPPWKIMSQTSFGGSYTIGLT
jgi:hypothetical protein